MNRRRHELQLESILNTQSKHTIEDSLRVPYVDRLPLKKVRFYVFTISHLCLRGTYLYPHGCSSANSLVSATETTGSGCAKPRGEVNLDDISQFTSGTGTARFARLRRRIKCSALQRQTQYFSDAVVHVCAVLLSFAPAHSCTIVMGRTDWL
jgi:hypothetical protein